MSARKTTPQTSTGIGSLSPAQRKQLANALFKARTNGQPWDGEGGIVNDAKFPLIKSAIVGRKLIREVGHGEIIAKSYDREAKGLKGPRQAPEPVAPAKAPRKRTRKAAAK